MKACSIDAHLGAWYVARVEPCSTQWAKACLMSLWMPFEDSNGSDKKFRTMDLLWDRGPTAATTYTWEGGGDLGVLIAEDYPRHDSPTESGRGLARK